MRLLNVETKRFEEFVANPPPPYAILSHRWGTKEATYQGIKEARRFLAKPWSGKLEGFGRQAKRDGLKYIWIDTCCIDKTNRVELGEAINSMFNWYKNAKRCYAYLADFKLKGTLPFHQSEWFTRGWTLQELLAPREVDFYDVDWNHIGTKTSKVAAVEKATGIPKGYLLGRAPLDHASIAQRMSWAANRKTTRKEDRAYCLLGLFGVSISMEYGDDTAFYRLQEAIMKQSGDQSILAWGFAESQHEESRKIPGGILASSPSDFSHSGKIVPCTFYKPDTDHFFVVVGGALQMRVPTTTDEQTGNTWGLLNCRLEDGVDNVIRIPFEEAETEQHGIDYIRPAQHRSDTTTWDPSFSSESRLLHVAVKPRPAAAEAMRRQHCFYVDECPVGLQLVEVEPRSRWAKSDGMILTSNGKGAPNREETLLRFRFGDRQLDDILVWLELERQSTKSGSSARASGNIMILPRKSDPTELTNKFETLPAELRGKTIAWTGNVSVEVNLTEGKVGRQTVFYLKLSKGEPLPGTETIDAGVILGRACARQRNSVIEQSLALEERYDNEKFSALMERKRRTDQKLQAARSREESAIEDIERAHRKVLELESLIKTTMSLCSMTEQALQEIRVDKVSLRKELEDNELAIMEAGLRDRSREEKRRQLAAELDLWAGKQHIKVKPPTDHTLPPPPSPKMPSPSSRGSPELRRQASKRKLSFDTNKTKPLATVKPSKSLGQFRPLAASGMSKFSFPPKPLEASYVTVTFMPPAESQPPGTSESERSEDGAEPAIGAGIEDQMTQNYITVSGTASDAGSIRLKALPPGQAQRTRVKFATEKPQGLNRRSETDESESTETGKKRPGTARSADRKLLSLGL
jgi:hypothetical protein